MAQQPIPICPKHSKQVIFICSLESCKEHRLICQTCKSKQTLHFSHHANYIFRFKEIKQFDNTKRTIPKLQKGITECETYILEHKKYYTQQISLIKEDFSNIRKQFNSISEQYERVYVQNFNKEIDKFDENINGIKNTLKQYIKQKNSQDSFFTMLFQNTQAETPDQLEATIKKNSKAYKVRADIINLRLIIAISKKNLTEYKKTEEDKRIMMSIQEELAYLSHGLFDKLKFVLGEDDGNTQNLKGSIANETKSLTMSKVSVGSLVDFQNDLKRSQILYPSQNLQRVQLPQLNQVVASVREKLKPLQPKAKGNIVFEGPFLFSTGVYFGQLDSNNKRQGWGQFVFHDGTIYQGQWDQDAICGFGRLIRNDCYYEGNVRNGKANGSGNYQDLYRYYSGEWKNDKRNGTGEEQFKNKSKKYVGNFIEDKYNGKGKLTTQQSTYEGKFKDGLFEGDGKIRFNNGQIFEGSFKEGEKHFGRHTYPDGSYYDGMFRDSVPNGTGQFFWADGLLYRGQWKSGVQQGIGVQIHQDGKEMKGIWKNGKWQKWL